MSGLVLIVDDERLLARDLAHILGRAGYQTAIANSAAEAASRVREIYPDVVLMDLCLPDGDGVETMVELKDRYREIEFIMVTAHGSIRSAVQSTKKGAFDYLTKPVEPDEILHAVENALQKKARDDELRHLRRRTAGGSSTTKEPATRYPSAVIRKTQALAGRASQREGNVLLLGESGTGKDHWARWIHRHSSRRDGPFFSINCAALSRELAESELFGHEPGAFTGTRGRKRGLLELASGGTLLLNEVGELDPGLQSKLLTFLDTKTFMRVGGERSVSVDSRILAATNRDLESEVEAGRFRRDLYYRLNVFCLELPPLRERADDLPILVDELICRLAREMGLSPAPTIDPDALSRLERYTWRGNIRELRNVLEGAMMLCDDRVLRAADFRLPEEQRDWRLEVPFPNGRNLHEVTRDVMRGIIEEALARTKTKTDAAKLLGISRDSLNYQIRVLGRSA